MQLNKACILKETLSIYALAQFLSLTCYIYLLY